MLMMHLLNKLICEMLLIKNSFWKWKPNKLINIIEICQICQISYSLYISKEVAKKVYSGYKKIVKQNDSYKNNIYWTL